MENTNETLNKSDKSALHNVLRLCVRLRSVGIERSGSLHKTAVISWLRLIKRKTQIEALNKKN